MRSPQVTQFINLQTTGVQQTQGQFDRLSASLNRYSQNLQKSTTQTKKQNKQLDYFSDQGLANIQTGLLQVTTFAMNINQKLNNIFEKMTNRFSTAEQAVTQLKISMGLIGKRTKANEHLYKDFDRMIKVVDRLAGTTKFTKVEVTNALNSLTRGGLEASQAIGLLDPIIKFVSASAGQIDLETGAEIARKTYSTLGGELSTVEDNLNRLFKSTQKTPLSMDKLNEFLTGIRDAAQMFGETDRMEANILALGAAMSSTGMDGREAGGLIKQFAKASMDIVSQLDKSRIRKGNRVRDKRLYILELLGVPKEKELRKIFRDSQTSLKRLQDKYAEQMFMRRTTTEDRVLKGPEQFIGTIIDSYAKLAKELGTGKAKVVLRKAFGKEVGSQFISAIDTIVEQNKQRGIGSYGELVNMLDLHNNEITTAHELSLDDLKSRADVLESSYDALFQSIMEHDVYGKESLETHSTVITAIKDLVKGNSSLAVSMSAIGRTAQIATSFITNLGFALVAAATFSIGLKYASKDVTGGVATLSSTIGAFHKTFLAPTLRILLLFGGGLVTGGLFAVAFARNLSDAGTVAGGFKETLMGVKKQVQSLVALFKLSTDKTFGSQTIGNLVKKYKELREEMRETHLKLVGEEDVEKAAQLEKQLENINSQYRDFQKVAGVENLQAFMELGDDKQAGVVSLMETLRLTFNAISSLVNGMLVPISFALEGVVWSFTTIAKLIFAPIQAILNLFGYFSDETGDSFALKAIGFLIGSFMALKVVVGSTSLLFNTLLGTFLKGQARYASLTGSISALTAQYKQLEQVKVLHQRTTMSGNRTDVLEITGFKQKISLIDKLALAYYKATGNTQKYQAVLDKLNGANLRLSTSVGTVSQKLTMNSAVLDQVAMKANKAKLSMAGLGGKFAAVGGGLMTFSMLAGQFGLIDQAFASIAMNIGLVLVSLPALFSVLKPVGLVLIAIFGKLAVGIAVAAAVIYGAYRLAKWVTGNDIKEEDKIKKSNAGPVGDNSSYASDSVMASARPRQVINHNSFVYHDNSTINTTDSNSSNVITARQKNINFFKYNVANESFDV